MAPFRQRTIRGIAALALIGGFVGSGAAVVLGGAPPAGAGTIPSAAASTSPAAAVSSQAASSSSWTGVISYSGSASCSAGANCPGAGNASLSESYNEVWSCQESGALGSPIVITCATPVSLAGSFNATYTAACGGVVTTTADTPDGLPTITNDGVTTPKVGPPAIGGNPVSPGSDTYTLSGPAGGVKLIGTTVGSGGGSCGPGTTVPFEDDFVFSPGQEETVTLASPFTTLAGSAPITPISTGYGEETGTVTWSFTAVSQSAPATSVLVPLVGATVSGSTTLDASATNATNVKFLLFGGSYGYAALTVCTASATPYGWLCSWSTTTVPNGAYTLISEASGPGGNTFSAGISITVKNSLPTTTILVPSNGVSLSGSTYLDASASNATSVEFLLFGGSYGYAAHVACTAATSTAYGWLCSWNTATVPNGTYALLSEAFGSGGSTFSSHIRITVKN